MFSARRSLVFRREIKTKKVFYPAGETFMKFFVLTTQKDSAIKGTYGLGSFKHWDNGFESHSRYGGIYESLCAILPCDPDSYPMDTMDSFPESKAVGA